MINIREKTAKLLKDNFNIDPETTELLFNEGILQEHHCRDILINSDYIKKIRPKEKNRVKGELAEKYCVSVSLVEKILGKKP